MFCMKCKNDLIDCTCPDIEERLKSLLDGPAGPAVAQNLLTRELKKQPAREKH